MKIPNRSLFLVAWAVWALTLPSNSLRAEEKSQTSEKHSLWKVKGKKNSVYLFGSIHFLKQSFYPLPDPIEAAYKKSGVVVFETDIEKMQTPETHEKIAKISKLPADETLPQKISKETYANLDKFLEDNGIPQHAFDSYQPWMTAVALLGIELQHLGFQPDQGVEKYFLAKAQEDKKQVSGLESVDSQLNLFGDLSKEDQEAMLKETLADVARFKSILSEMVDAWKTGDSKALDTLILKEMRSFPDLQKKLLLDRNKKWVESLEKMVDGDKDVFVTVGAGHLVGKDSVVELLEKKGFKIEQL